jgi:hypothetical protein
MAPPHLTTLPPEVLHHIFTWLDPADIVTLLPHVCSALRAFTHGNRKLHRDVYLQHLVNDISNQNLPTTFTNQTLYT